MSEFQAQERVLANPTRRRIFEYLLDAGRPVDIAELTAHHGVNHNAVRQHLARLVAVGLVSAQTTAPSGPGRPRLMYLVDPGVAGTSNPYERLSVMLAEVIRTGRSPRDVGREQGRRHTIAPRDAQDAGDQLGEVVARDGFDPEVRTQENRVDILLRRCPFETTAVADPDIVCALHLGIAEGLVDDVAGVAVDELVAQDPRRAQCRLSFHLDG